MDARTLALIFGVAYALVGVLGFIPGLTQPPPEGAPSLALAAGYGSLLGLFPVNVLHNLIHLVAGLWGVAVWRGMGSVRTYGRVLTVVFGAFVVMGLIPGLNTTFGLAPLFGNDVWLHALTAAITAYIGWFAPLDEAARTA